jgi:hypothetical protein
MEIACKAANGKSVCAFPDVCFTPPQTPATPPGVPIPYPNTGLASDTTSGSTTVFISGQQIMLKNKSYFQKSTGNEAGCATKKGVITSKITGKVYFNSWSMDVKVEGENVVRHLDMTTHNHASSPGNTLLWPYIDEMAFAVDSSHPCKELAQQLQTHCQKHVDSSKNKKGQLKRRVALKKICEEDSGNGNCKKAMTCVLTPKSPSNCCPDASGVKPTPHHIVPAAQFHDGTAAEVPLSNLLDASGKSRYSYDKAPCICAEGNSHSTGKHGEIHGETNTRTRAFLEIAPSKKIPTDMRWPITYAERIGAEAVEASMGDNPKCTKECTQSQLRNGHEAMGIGRNEKIRPSTAGGEAKPGGPIPLPA